MKKFVSILLAALFVLAFAACGNNGGTPAGDKVTDPLEVLNKTWSSLPEDYKFPAAGGDNNHPVEDKPGTFDISDADSLDYMLSFPADSASLIDSAASISHMMNMNTFTCGAYHVVITINEVVVAMYGDEELINSFRDTLTGAYSGAVINFDEAIQ